MTAHEQNGQIELDLDGAGPGAEDGPWARGWVRRVPPAVLADNLEQMVDYVATLNIVSYGERDGSLANEAWQNLPEHLRRAIMARESVFMADMG